ncbi:helix-turn-helix domain-containing protein [Leptospira stimsonii]|uniref:XRE family transcriptional regulator n=1 Tax=Leptospira stimsonii TaxID=2202203 RepID=A0ABY2MZP4_9LEPT|nr:helix-turn-helix transcriptional regulator [Leptospira stimsonii]TGK18837.1 XRE family transcriptional regulator [Leptospira stimsonii]TGM12907.1 XRE family transcriptional regulator [Leptospira stimsonii]
MEINQILKNLLRKQGWTQEDLAIAGEVSQPAVSRYLSGQNVPTLDFIINLYKNKKIDPIIFVRDFELEPFRLESNNSKDDKNFLVDEVTLFIRFVKNSPEVLDIFWKLHKMDKEGRNSMNAFADRILEG